MNRTRGSYPTDSPTEGHRLRMVGGVHLGLAAVTNLATGLVLLYLGVTNQLVRIAFSELDTYMTAEAVVRAGDTIAAVASTGAALVGVALVILGSVTACVAYSVSHCRRVRWWVPASVASAVNPLATPPGFIAAVLLWLGRRSHTRQPSGRT